MIWRVKREELPSVLPYGMPDGGDFVRVFVFYCQ